jgi:hypothetical protein
MVEPNAAVYFMRLFFVRAACDDPDRVIRRWPLQGLGLIPWRAHPNITLLVCVRDDRHSLRVDGFDYRVR